MTHETLTDPARPDSELVDATVRGERQSFAVLVQRYNQRLFRIALSYLQREDLVEDAMQNAYLKAFTHLADFQGRSAFATWLTRILINECLLILRRQRSSREQSAETTDEPEPATGADLARDAAAAGELRVMLEAAIARLPQDLRTVYVMREIQQMDTQETADAMGITIENVRVRLHRARDLLKDRLLATAAGMELFTYGSDRCQRMTAGVMRRLGDL